MDKAIPNKLFFKIGEVCEITDTQPYVLRYWESEFPELRPKKNRAGNRSYRRDLGIGVQAVRIDEDRAVVIPYAGPRSATGEDMFEAIVHGSQALVEQVIEAAVAAGDGLWILVRPSEHAKCVRCWHHREDVGMNTAHPELCGRCVENVDGSGEQRRYA